MGKSSNILDNSTGAPVGAGRRIAELRSGLGLTASELAKILENSDQRIRDIEAGRQRAPEDVLAKIMEIFHTNGSWLLLGKGPVFTSRSAGIDTFWRFSKKSLVLDRLKILRDEIGLNKKEFAESISIDPHRFIDLHHGAEPIPLSVLEAVSERFKRSILWILTGQETFFESDLFPNPIQNEKSSSDHSEEERRKLQFFSWLNAWWTSARLCEKHWFLVQMERTFPAYLLMVEASEGKADEEDIPTVQTVFTHCPRCNHKNSYRPDGDNKIMCFGCKQPYHVGLVPEKAPAKKAKISEV